MYVAVVSLLLTPVSGIMCAGGCSSCEAGMSGANDIFVLGLVLTHATHGYPFWHAGASGQPGNVKVLHRIHGNMGHVGPCRDGCM